MSRDIVRQMDEIRKEAGLSCGELAKRAGYGRSTIAHWFDGHRDPRLIAFSEAAEALGYDVVLVKKNNGAAQ